MLSAPFALDNRLSQQTRRLGVLAVLGWLRTQPGDSWQQRWQASGAEDQPDWRRLVGTDPAKPLPHLSPGLLVLICADVIRPSLDWLLRFAPARHNLAVEMARTRDPSGAFTALTALCRSGRVGLQSQQQALTNVAIIMAAKGGPVEQVRVGDCVELLATVARTRRHDRQTSQQPAVLSTAARAWRPRSRCARRDRDVLRPWTAQLRAADRPLPDRVSARCATCSSTTCANVSRRWTSPRCNASPTCWANCSGPIWRPTTPVSTRFNCPAMSPRRGSNG